ncbi:MAG: hypothetical protein HND48_23745 [Chloroflexi bacterium]|nr:hypothetical protein [Chloroflexota bacterium]
MRLILSLILSVLVGAAMGGLLFGADMIGFYLILLMPLAVGALVGLATSFPAVPGRIPTFPLLVVALIGCAAAVVVYWGATYLQYREEFVKVAQENIAVGRDEALALLPEFEQEAYGTTGFPAMLALLAEEGLSITRTGSSSSSSGLLLQGGIAYAYWIGEIVLMVIVAWVSVFRRYTTELGQEICAGADGRHERYCPYRPADPLTLRIRESSQS